MANPRLPNQNSPPLQSSKGQMSNHFGDIWFRFFASLIAPATAPEAVTLGVSPATISITAYGTLYVNGGTVTAITITRQGTTINTGAIAGAIPVANGDEVTITYAVAPTVNFLGA